MSDKRLLIPVMFLSLLLSCCGKSDAPSTGAQRPVSAVDPVFQISGSDEQLHAIARRARETLPEFIRKLQNPGPGERDFRIKYPFRADTGSGFTDEHIWLTDITFKEGGYYGTIANQPYYVSRLNAGDQVSFYIDDISDWMYRRGEAIIGGLSIKYLIEQTPEIDRDAAASAWHARFSADQ
jgi:uncharacterized protein YegJ (DUF2314 family)